jgi:hypothetical protein
MSDCGVVSILGIKTPLVVDTISTNDVAFGFIVPIPI